MVVNLRQAAKDEPCMRCGRNDGTTVLAHYNGFYNHYFGNGMGKKSHDLAGAHLCHNCHTLFDQHKIEHREEEFLSLCLRTVIKLYEKGVIK